MKMVLNRPSKKSEVGSGKSEKILTWSGFPTSHFRLPTSDFRLTSKVKLGASNVKII